MGLVKVLASASLDLLAKLFEVLILDFLFPLLFHDSFGFGNSLDIFMAH